MMNDEARRIIRDELFPVFDGVGNLRASGNAADLFASVFEMRLQLGDAQRILTEKLIPLFEREDDVCSAALARQQVDEIVEVDEQLQAFSDRMILGDCHCVVTENRGATPLEGMDY